jgi:hypothetical protein
MAALLSVREDRERADRLMEILRKQGVELDSSASAFERPGDYEACVALFSPHAVKSSLLLWAAQQALDARRLVPVYLSLTAIPKAFALTPIHDLHEWAGEADHSAVIAIQRHVLRLHRTRNEHDSLANLGRGRAGAAGVRLTPEAGPLLVEGMPPELPSAASVLRAPQAAVRALSEFETPAARAAEPLLQAWRGPDRPPEAGAMGADDEADQASVSAAARRRRLIQRERMLNGLAGDRSF